ncbi:hypothetical protein [Streptomyces sp. NPDC049915]|uniref:hypothetical protein n=1 Tax=Streptomyces sp. NPDC049915 TaxID=3155510 RepID=UPI0034227FC7
MTYLTVAVQLALIPAVLTRRRWIREAVLLLIAGMHIGIMYGMGLVSFGLFMLAADAAMLTDADYRAAARLVRGARRRLRQRRENTAPPAEPPSGQSPPVPPQRDATAGDRVTAAKEEAKV